MANMEKEQLYVVHQGRNIKRIREMLGVKQEALAMDLGLSQQAISSIEQREAIEPDMLEKIAAILKVPVESIKNFDEEKAINIFSNNFHDFKDHAVASAMNYHCSFNPLDKVLELFERLLESEREKTKLLKEVLERIEKK
jgi:transcriptional regulator with XRE-family HTH domain